MIAGAQTSTYTPDATSIGTTYYYCVVSNECSSNVQGPISEAMIVNESIVIDESIDQTQTICLGESLNPVNVLVSTGSVVSYPVSYTHLTLPTKA